MRTRILIETLEGILGETPAKVARKKLYDEIRRKSYDKRETRRAYKQALRGEVLQTCEYFYDTQNTLRDFNNFGMGI